MAGGADVGGPSLAVRLPLAALGGSVTGLPQSAFCRLQVRRIVSAIPEGICAVDDFYRKALSKSMSKKKQQAWAAVDAHALRQSVRSLLHLDLCSCSRAARGCARGIHLVCNYIV